MADKEITVVFPTTTSIDIANPLGNGFSGSRGITGYTGSRGYRGSLGYTGSSGLGYTGSVGYTGSAGAGFTGSKGAIGYTGSRGLTGSTGFDGSRGVMGLRGYTGSRGQVGSRGFTGSFGETGYTGSKGEQGLTGSQGARGYSGSRGFVGSRGVLGYTGSQGEDGARGYSGSRGFTGSRGSTGLRGYDGSRGLTGSRGFTGSFGETGYTGSQGLTGSRGLRGFDGSQGIIGYTGSRGSLGFTGSMGLHGLTGSRGFRGYSGSRGYTGLRGYTGSRGLIGYAGSGGSRGLQGYVGSQGFTGNTGFTGSKGRDGEPGPAGGFTGSRGPVGYIGSAGATGFVGSQGIRGFAGSAGHGYTGSRGATGFVGSVGSLGYTGSAGSGFTGSTGALGYTGSRGLRGFVGSFGPAGSRGYAGSRGERGWTGYVGSSGLGYTGSGGVGFTGSRGFTGAAGANGAVGFTGSRGIGIPPGGTTNQVLAKVDDTDYNVQWIDVNVNSATYWRFSNIDTEATTLQLSEMRLEDEFNNILVPSSASYREPETLGGASSAFDANSATSFFDYFPDGLTWLQFVYDTPIYPDHVFIEAPSFPGDGPRAATSWTLERSVDNGNTWITVLEVVGETPFADGETRTYDVPSTDELSAQEVLDKLLLNANVNILTDAEYAKLGGIESGATADQTGLEIVTAINTELGSNTWQSVVGGYTGSRGLIGYSGSRGAVGFVGSAGVGFVGSRGFIGYTGSAGSGASLSNTEIVAAINTELGSNTWQDAGGSGFTGSRGFIGYTGSAGAVVEASLVLTPPLIADFTAENKNSAAGAATDTIDGMLLTGVDDAENEWTIVTKALDTNWTTIEFGTEIISMPNSNGASGLIFMAADGSFRNIGIGNGTAGNWKLRFLTWSSTGNYAGSWGYDANFINPQTFIKILKTVTGGLTKFTIFYSIDGVAWVYVTQVSDTGLFTKIGFCVNKSDQMLINHFRDDGTTAFMGIGSSGGGDPLSNTEIVTAINTELGSNTWQSSGGSGYTGSAGVGYTGSRGIIGYTGSAGSGSSLSNTEIVTAINTELGSNTWQGGGDGSSAVGTGYASFTSPDGLFTAVNGGTAIVNGIDDTGSWQIKKAGSTGMSYAHTSSGITAGADFDVVVVWEARFFNSNYGRMGVGFRDSSNGRATFFNFFNADGNRFGRQYWNETTYVSESSALLIPQIFHPSPAQGRTYWRFKRVGTVVEVYISYNGLRWMLAHTETITAGSLTDITQIAAYVDTGSVTASLVNELWIVGYDSGGPQGEIMSGGISTSSGSSLSNTEIVTAINTELGSNTWQGGGGSGSTTIEELTDTNITVSSLTAAHTGQPIVWDDTEGKFIVAPIGFDTLKLAGGMDILYQISDMSANNFTGVTLDEANYDIDQYDEIIIVLQNASTRLSLEHFSDGGVSQLFWQKWGRWADNTHENTSHTQFYIGSADSADAQQYAIAHITGHHIAGAPTIVESHGSSAADTDEYIIGCAISATLARHNAFAIIGSGGATITAGSLTIYGIKKSRQPLEYSAHVNASWSDEQLVTVGRTMGIKYRAGSTVGKIFLTAAGASDHSFSLIDSDGSTVIATTTITAGNTEGSLIPSTDVTTSPYVYVKCDDAGEAGVEAEIVIRGETA